MVVRQECEAECLLGSIKPFMNQDSQQRSHSRMLLGWPGGVAALLMFYVFSSGPALYLRERGVVSQRTIDIVYMPLFPLEHWNVSEAYFKWWVEKGATK